MYQNLTLLIKSSNSKSRRNTLSYSLIPRGNVNPPDSRHFIQFTLIPANEPTPFLLPLLCARLWTRASAYVYTFQRRRAKRRLPYLASIRTKNSIPHYCSVRDECDDKLYLILYIRETHMRYAYGIYPYASRSSRLLMFWRSDLYTRRDFVNYYFSRYTASRHVLIYTLCAASRKI